MSEKRVYHPGLLPPRLASDPRRTDRVAAAALRSAGGDPRPAAARLRLRAQEAVLLAWSALENRDGDERVLELLETAARRLRAAGGLEQRERTP